jgi:hypothetical protein
MDCLKLGVGFGQAPYSLPRANADIAKVLTMDEARRVATC